MTDKTDVTPRRMRPAQQKLMTLAQAAFNADETVVQVEALIAGAAETMGELNNSVDSIDATMVRFGATLTQIEELTPRLIDILNQMETLVDRVEGIVGIGETLVSPIAATEQALRGVMSNVRSKRGKDGGKGGVKNAGKKAAH